MTEAWRKAWRDGVAPIMSGKALEALRAGLAADDPQLVQRATAVPTDGGTDCPAWGACAIGYCGWKGEGLETVGEVEEFFGRACFEIDKAVGVPAGCGLFTSWYDLAPRQEMRRELLAEVELALAGRRLALAVAEQDEAA